MVIYSGLHLSATWFSLCNLCVLCASVVKFRSHPYENRYREPWCILTPRFFYSNDGRYSVHNECYRLQFLELDKAFEFIAERYSRHEIHIEEAAYDCLVRWNRVDLLSRIKGTFYAGYFGRPEG